MEAKLGVPKITVQEVLQGTYPLIDVRSPSEYEEFHIPGAINIPIFSDQERAQVGTIYKQLGKEAAKELGVSILSKKLPQLYEKVKEVNQAIPNHPMVVYCWRGGMRSRSIVSVMGMLEVPIFQLEGGIRSYRQLIMDELEQAQTNTKKYIVLEGLTGTNKTDILDKLEEQGYPVINIERLVNHRGSVFGQIGLKARSQKEFESLLYMRLIELKDSTYYIIEAESKRVGNVVIPEFLMAGKENGVRIHVEMELEKRVQNICTTYRLHEHSEQFEEAISRIRKRLPLDTYNEISELLKINDYERIVLLLLRDYYDPMYDYAAQKYNSPIHTISFKHVDEGLEKVTELIKEIVNSYSHI
jgi:tRNA 2-selenouridine synthase